jgi:hypothetical protein
MDGNTCAPRLKTLLLFLVSFFWPSYHCVQTVVASVL